MTSLDGIGMTSQRTRHRMVERLAEQGIDDWQVLDAILTVPRHIFVDEALAHRAYEDSSLPIGYQQTLSQPYIVARMTQLLMQVKPKKVLEIGAGSGYQSMVLSQLVDSLYSVERIKPLLEKARQRAHLLKRQNVQFFHRDGGLGLADKAPFDGILSAAAPRFIPEDLKEQLAVGGRLVIPVGDKQQHLVVVDRQATGFVEKVIEPVNFVPLVTGSLA